MNNNENFCELAWKTCLKPKCFRCKNFISEALLIRLHENVSNDNKKTLMFELEDTGELMFMEHDKLIILSSETENFGVEIDIDI